MQIIEGATLEELWKKTCEICKDGAKENLIIHGQFNILEVRSNFINIYRERAEKWRLEDKPEELIINHGQYINKAGKGIDFIIRELKRKPKGNRACYSLINMRDIVESGDNAIPSFMILQFSLSNENDSKLLVSAYFRALECSQFLPVNLAEISLNIEDIYCNIPTLSEFELNIYAFRVQVIENFNCLNKSSFDINTSSKYAKWIIKDKKSIISALKDKINSVESIIITHGTKALLKAIEESDEEDLGYRVDITKKLEEILEKMEKLKTMRENTSIHKGAVEELTNKISVDFEFIIEKLEEQV